MSRSLLTPLRGLACVTALLVVASVVPSRWSAWVSQPAKVVLNFAATPVVRAGRWLSLELRSAQPRWSDSGDLGQVRGRLDQAEAMMKQLLEENRFLREQVAQMRKNEQFMNRDDVAQVPASVTASVPGPPPMLVLRVPHADGVRRERAVVYYGSFVGEVSDLIVPAQAEVRLVTGMEVQARLRPEDRAEPRELPPMIVIPAGDGWRYDIGRDHVVAVGDDVYLDDDRWPLARGFSIGDVVAVDDHPKQPLTLRRITIKPRAPLMHLTRVMVLTPVGG